MKQKRVAILVGLSLLAVAAVVIIIGLMSTTPKQPSSAPYQDGDNVSLVGKSVCLRHAVQGGAQTMECAIGILASDGKYYAVRDQTQDYTLVGKLSAEEEVRVEGIYRATGDTKYLQSGTIELSSVIPLR